MKRFRLNEVFKKLVKDLKLARHLFIQAIAIILENKEKLARALMIPFLFTYTLVLIIQQLPESLFLYILNIPYYAVYFLIAITTHRMVLIGPDSVPKWGITKWSKRETLFAIHSVAIFSLWIGSNYVTYQVLEIFFSEPVPSSVPLEIKNELEGAVRIIDFSGMAIYLSAAMLAPLVLSQFSLIFPAVATDKDNGPMDAWKLARGYRFLVMLMAILIPYPIKIVFQLAGDTIFSDMQSQYFYLLLCVEEQLYFLFQIIFISMLSVTYKHITEEKQKTHPQPWT